MQVHIKDKRSCKETESIMVKRKRSLFDAGSAFLHHISRVTVSYVPSNTIRGMLPVNSNLAGDRMSDFFKTGGFIV